MHALACGKRMGRAGTTRSSERCGAARGGRRVLDGFALRGTTSGKAEGVCRLVQ